MLWQRGTREDQLNSPGKVTGKRKGSCGFVPLAVFYIDKNLFLGLSKSKPLILISIVR